MVKEKIEKLLMKAFQSIAASKEIGKRMLALMLAASVLIATLPVFELTASADGGTPEVWDGTTAAYFDSGTGTEDNPYQIATAEQLSLLAAVMNGGADKEVVKDSGSVEYADLQSAHYKLTDDIVLNDVSKASSWDENTTGLNSWTPIGAYDNTNSKKIPFSGTFDGNGHTVSGIYINSSEDYQGLFGYIGTGGAVKNVGVTDSYIKGGNYVGGVAGYSNGTVSDCYNTGAVSGTRDDVGGVVGYSSGTVSNCYNTGAVSGTSYVGGVAGENENDGTVSNCYNTGAVSGTSYVGGVAGYNGGTVSNCYNTGAVSGAVSGVGSDVGGVAGLNCGTVSNCYYDNTVDSKVGGAINGVDDPGNKVMGKTTDEMQTATPFTNWTTDVWTFQAGKYPQLKAFIPPVHWQDGSTGTDTGWYDDSKDSFTITTAAKLAGLAKLVNAGTDFSGKTVILGKNIILNDVSKASSWDENTTGLNSWTPIGTYTTNMDNKPFKGTFDGDGHTVGGIYINSASDYQGLFGYIGENGTAKDVGVISSYIKGGKYVGGVAGYGQGSIENCYNAGSMNGEKDIGGVTGYNDSTVQACYNSGTVCGTGDNIGGVAGYTMDALTACYNTGKVSGKNNVGGVAGNNYNHSIETCYNTGAVCGTGDGVGGVVGNSKFGSVETCYNIGEVSGGSSSKYVGGVAGMNFSGVQTCYNTGAVSGTSYVGGVVGENKDTVKNCYNTGAVSGTSKVGGVAGRNSNDGTVSDCYYDNKKCNKVVGAIDGADDKKNNVMGKTTAEMQTATPYTNWSAGVWIFQSGEYPQLMVFINWQDGSTGIDTNWYWFNYGSDSFTLTTAAELVGLAKLVNGVNGGIDFKDKTVTLGKNIVLNDVTGASSWDDGTTGLNPWTPIGTYDYEHSKEISFGGTFDGDGHTVSGIYINSSKNYQGLFGYIGTGGAVKNVGVTDSYIKGKNDVGGVAGVNGGTVSNCYNTGVVSGDQFVGGVAGCNSDGGTVSYCYNTGAVSSTGDYVGGVVGANGGTVSNCYNTGAVSDESSVSGESSVGGVAGYSSGTVSDCYYDNTVDSEVGGAIEGADDKKNNVMGKTTDEMQTATPFTNWSTEAWTFQSGEYPQLTVFFSPVKWKDGSTGTDTGWYDDSRDSFTITTAAKLAGLAKLVNDGTDFKDKTVTLGKDIILNDVSKASSWDENTTGLNSWTPIGTYDNTKYKKIPFSGTFDGDGHTVSGIYINSSEDYQGLFGYIGTGGAVKNVGVTDSYIKGKNFVGGVAGENHGTVSDCYNTGAVSGTNDVGGVVGHNDDDSKVTDCYNTGAVSGTSYVGGVVGENSGTVLECYNTGVVSGDSVAGGVVGRNDGTVSDCYYDNQKCNKVGGAINGVDDPGNKVMGKTTDKMQTATPFTNWNTDVWTFQSGEYPQLTVFLPPVEWKDGSTGTDTGWYDEHSSETNFTITTAAKLAGLAKLVNAGNSFKDKTVTLGKDIILNDVSKASSWDENTKGLNSWTPIGNYNSESDNKPFSGTFDGDGHTVSGIYIKNSSEDSQGLFGYIGGGAVKNVGVTDSYIKGKDNVGGVAGLNVGTVQTCYNTGVVSGNQFVGGVAGLNVGTVQTCYNTGVVSGTGNKVGGVAGENYGTVKTCYNTGAVSGGSSSQFVGGVAGKNDGTVSDCYYDNTVDSKVGGAINGVDDPGNKVMGKTSAEMKTATPFTNWNTDVWTFQSGKYPQLTVFLPVKWKDGSTGTDTGWYDEHSSETNFTITTAAKLAGLAKLVNAETDFSGKTVTLGKNIILNDVSKASSWDENTTGLNSWTPIGTYDSTDDQEIPFSGTFDGDGHTVSGIYINSSEDCQGLFGYIGTGGTVKNVGVTDSYIKGKKGVGGVDGVNEGTVQTCYNTGAVSGGSSSQFVGGVVGANFGTVQTCYNTGAVSGTGNYVGGVAGANGGTVSNCYNTGAVSGTNNIGGVAGYNDDDGTVSDCYYDNQTCKGVSAIGEGTATRTDGKPSAEMKTATPFTNWNTDVWTFQSGKYPQLTVFVSSSSACDVSSVTTPSKAKISGGNITAGVGNAINSVTVGLKVSDKAGWKLYSDPGCTKEITSKKMSLSVGANTAYVKVTAEDGTTTKIYTLTITRAALITGKSNSTSDSVSDKGSKTQTETHISPNENTATVTTVADSITQTGDTTEISVSVPTVTIDTTGTEMTLNTAQPAEVQINLPVDTVKQQLAAGKDVDLTLAVPHDVAADANGNVSLDINASKDIFEAAKASGQDVTLRVRDMDMNEIAYTWTFKGEDLAKSSVPATDINIAMSIHLTTEVAKVQKITPDNKGLVLSFDHSGALPSTANMKFSAKEKGFKPGDTMYLYFYNPTTGQIDPLGRQYTVDAFGFVNVQIDHCSDYVLLPNVLRSITLDTRTYTMKPGDSYVTGVTLTNAPGTVIKAYSSSKGVANVTVLSNGNVKATGLKAGQTYIMIDVCDNKNKLLIHTSVRLTVENGVKANGNSAKQYGIF